ncbi:MAG: hypothetical protein WEB60_04290 [Terrimicrobiaceae bacterium]
MKRLEQDIARGLREHNRHCWLAAATSLFFAWLAWVFFYGIFGAMVLLFETITQGETATFPKWLNPAFGGLAATLLLWGGISRWVKRFRPPPDRPVIGWHLLPDVLLLPATLTFAVGEHLDARLRLSHHEKSEAARLLAILSEIGRTTVSELGFHFSQPKTLQKLLTTLQFLGWIDLHRGEDDFFYRLRSDREEPLAQLLDPSPDPPTE